MATIAVRKAPYKDFLQPALHRRFSKTATVLLAISYLEAIALSEWNSFIWTWFPLGPAGFRTAFLFGCGLAILILRIAQYHVGMRTTGSGWTVFRASLTSLQTYETAFWYGLSSLVFGHIFLWSMSDKTGLGWVTHFSGDRVKLNERPIFLIFYMATCALTQTIAHYGRDYDRLDLGQANSAGKNNKTVNAVLTQLPIVLMGCARQAIGSLPLAILLYLAFFRSTIWGWTLMFMRPFHNMPKTNFLPPTWPFDIWLLARCVSAGTLVCFIWASGNTAFSLFMVGPPLKNGKPLTSESKDPNGSLLSGLKSKKLPIKCFAMWELALISESFDVRRQAIFDDIDRKDGPMWSQIYAICMDVIKSIETRVDNYGKPPAPAQPGPVTEEPRQRTTAPLRDDPIYSSQSRARGFPEKAIEQVARSQGTTPASKLSPIVKRKWQEAKDAMLSKEQQDAITPNHARGQLEQLAVEILKVDYIGSPFRQDFRTQFTAAVLGGPHVEPELYISAVVALSQLAVKSLDEDKFGNVYRDVASIVRTLSAVIKKVEGLRSRFPVHWTDVTGSKATPEVDRVLDAMRDGLERILAQFEKYGSDLRLTATDLRTAKEAIVKPKPVAEVVEEKPKEKKIEREQEKPPAKEKEKARERPKAGPRHSSKGVKTPEMEQVRQ